MSSIISAVIFLLLLSATFYSAVADCGEFASPCIQGFKTCHRNGADGAHPWTWSYRIYARSAYGSTETQPFDSNCEAIRGAYHAAGCATGRWSCEAKWGTCPIAEWGSCYVYQFDPFVMCSGGNIAFTASASNTGAGASAGISFGPIYGVTDQIAGTNFGDLRGDNAAGDGVYCNLS